LQKLLDTNSYFLSNWIIFAFLNSEFDALRRKKAAAVLKKFLKLLFFFGTSTKGFLVLVTLQ
jgi:hypothetical protein